MSTDSVRAPAEKVAHCQECGALVQRRFGAWWCPTHRDEGHIVLAAEREASTDVIRFTNPTTGELLTLDAPDEDLARYLEDIREHERRVREHKHLVNRELIGRFDRAAKWTHHIGGVKLSTSSPKPQESWDGAELREALLRFVDEGILSIEAVDAAVSTEIAYKVKANGVKSLRSLGGEIAEAIEGLVTRSEKDRYISIGRS